MRHAKTGRTKVKAREEKEIIKNTEKEEIDRFRNKAELIACTCRVVKIYRSCCYGEETAAEKPCFKDTRDEAETEIE